MALGFCMAEDTNERGKSEGLPLADWSQLFRAALPLVLINLAVTGMQFADAVMVAPLGEAALAAIFPAGILWLLPVAFGHGVLGLVNTFVANSFGKGAFALCGRYANQGLWFSVGLGFVIVLQGPLAPLYFRWFGHAPEVQALERDYFTMLVWAGFPALVVATLSNFFTGLLRPKILVVAAVLATVLNVLFNWVLIFGKFGFPEMGIKGAALGTCLATVVQAGFLLFFYWGPAMRREFGTDGWKLDREVMGRLIRFGFPAGGMPLIDLFNWGIMVTWVIGWFGTSQLAANTVAIRYLHLAFMPSFAFGAVLTAMVGQSIGRKDREGARRHARNAFMVIGGYMTTVGLCFFVWRRPLMELFSSDPEVIATGMAIMVCAAIYQPFDAAFLTFSHALRGAGDTLWPTVILLVCSAVILVGGSLGLALGMPELKSIGPWMATTAYAGALGCLMWLRWQRGAWEKIRLGG